MDAPGASSPGPVVMATGPGREGAAHSTPAPISDPIASQTMGDLIAIGPDCPAGQHGLLSRETSSRSQPEDDHEHVGRMTLPSDRRICRTTFFPDGLVSGSRLPDSSSDRAVTGGAPAGSRLQPAHVERVSSSGGSSRCLCSRTADIVRTRSVWRTRFAGCESCDSPRKHLCRDHVSRPTAVSSASRT